MSWTWVHKGIITLLSGAILSVSSQGCLHLSSHSVSVSIAEFCAMVSAGLMILGSSLCLLGCLCIQRIHEYALASLKRKKQLTLQAQQLKQHKSELEELLKQADVETVQHV